MSPGHRFVHPFPTSEVPHGHVTLGAERWQAVCVTLPRSFTMSIIPPMRGRVKFAKRFARPAGESGGK